ncbi:MAG: FtsX-like permease family protein [Eggerthellaceae bacterium]|jgi:ABC-type antimicrobial peptide transport system permease subunit|nr:FtsX-like permease family protein [Eggerthellaceae bacterium]
MKALATLIKAAIRARWGGLCGIACLVFVIATLLGSISSLYTVSAQEDTRALDQAGYGSIVSFIPQWTIDDATVDSAAACAHVTHIDQYDSLYCGSSRIGDVSSSQVLFVCPFNQTGTETTAGQPEHTSIDQNGQQRYRVFNQHKTGFIDSPEAPQGQEIYLPITAADQQHCAIGDSVTLWTGTDYAETFTIKGFIEEPLLGANVIDAKYYLISEEAYARLSATADDLKNRAIPGDTPDCHHVTNLNMYTDTQDSATLAQVQRSINDTCDLFSQAYATLTIEQSMSYTMIMLNLLCSMLFVFVTLLGLVTLLVIRHSISSALMLDYANLGILKTQGFTTSMLRIVVLVQYVGAALIGITCSLLCDIPVIQALAPLFVPVTGLLATASIDWMLCIPMLIAILLIIIGVVFFKTHALTAISPLDAMRSSFEGKRHVNTWMIPVICHRTGLLDLKLAFHQMSSAPVRYIGTTFIIALLIFSPISIASMDDAYSETNISRSFGVPYYALSITDSISSLTSADAPTQENIAQTIAQHATIVRQYSYDSCYMEMDGLKYLGLAYGAPDDFQSVYEGTAPLNDHEIVITELVAQQNNVRIGDSIELSSNGSTATYTICGYMSSIADGGNCFGMLVSGKARLYNVPNAEIDPTLRYVFADAADAEDAHDALRSTYPTVQSTVGGTYDKTLVTAQSTVQTLETLIYVFVSIFSLVIVVMLCSRAVAHERRDLAILKHLGFSSGRLRRQFALRFFITALCGALLGIILIFVGNNALLDLILSNVGLPHNVTHYTFQMIALPTTLIVLLFVVGSFVAARSIHWIDIHELLSS